MKRRTTLATTLFLMAAAGTLAAQGAGMKPDQAVLMKSAMAAAPPKIAQNATIKDWDGTTLKEGSNGWTCLPDLPSTPEMDPMCLDATWVSFLQAWQNHAQPDVETPGLAYMLQGGASASNTDPFAEVPAAGQDWIKDGPHVMIVLPDMARANDLPTDPDNGGPYVMWKDTPYAHIMMPVGAHGKMDGMKAMEMDKTKEMKDKKN